ncbi:hypothetical protein EDD66_112120 [Mobilisporobacter senegalensis]|uniref:Peptidase C39-like domain-containing protein n=1 Tax=Mobilisporobacter senegalensis TaxID=1329262 RepID=A0A3N1XB47_9FIRM|nr:hypothetical protein [Mobilisporobacter senegalensis]ROR23989.1 hypothetical protein EDD66_112120 [Mobilisporobacter senegalensis]
MRKELPYFNIENSFGGNQTWFRDPMMKLGGCAAATACDACINMALNDNKSHLYPYDELNKEEYIKFCMTMKPYLRPRFGGIKTLGMFIEGLQEYFKDVGERNLKLKEYPGEMQSKEAASEIQRQIDNNRAVPFLLLKHKSPNFRYFTWHWFLIVGYEKFENDFYVKIATYGNFHWLSFHELWATGYKEKGGAIMIY